MCSEIDYFNEARKLYGGVKRGNETEFANFKKRHKDWKKVLPLLKPAVERQRLWRKQAMGAFRPPWKNFQTWINQRCWEDEVEVKEYVKRKPKPKPELNIKPLAAAEKKAIRERIGLPEYINKRLDR